MTPEAYIAVVGLGMTAIGSLLGLVWHNLVTKVQGMEEKFVTRELFDERTNNQDRALKRIEQRIARFSPLPRDYRRREPDSEPPEDDAA